MSRKRAHLFISAPDPLQVDNVRVRDGVVQRRWTCTCSSVGTWREQSISDAWVLYQGHLRRVGAQRRFHPDTKG